MCVRKPCQSRQKTLQSKEVCMGRMSRKGFTLYELVVSVVVLGALGLFVGVCGSLIYWLINTAH